MDLQNKIDELSNEVAFLKVQVEELKTQNEEYRQEINEKIKSSREFLDINIRGILRKRVDKINMIAITFSSVISCVLLVYMEYISAHGCSTADIMVCTGYLTVSTGIMVVSTLILMFLCISDVCRFIKNKEWKRSKNKNGK